VWYAIPIPGAVTCDWVVETTFVGGTFEVIYSVAQTRLGNESKIIRATVRAPAPTATPTPRGIELTRTPLPGVERGTGMNP
jgi:hypothetical protein